MPDANPAPESERDADGGREPRVPPDADTESDAETNADGDNDDHVADLPDGAGCTEIWEHLSERRD